jgi:hypothetical protein
VKSSLAVLNVKNKVTAVEILTATSATSKGHPPVCTECTTAPAKAAIGNENDQNPALKGVSVQ